MFAKIAKVLVLIAAVCCAVSVGINYLNLPKIYNSHWHISVIFFLSTALLINMILFRNQADPRDFTFKIMMTSMLRILLCMIGVFIYSLVNKPALLGFVTHFMSHYILFTVFEIAYLLRYTKSQHKP